MSKDKESIDPKTIGDLFDKFIEEENVKHDAMTLKDYAIAIEEAKTYKEVERILLDFSTDSRFDIENIMTFSAEDRVYHYYIMSRKQNMHSYGIFNDILETYIKDGE